MSRKTILKPEAHELIKAEDLLEEIKIALRDAFVAKFYRQGQELNITFLNGQKFTLTLQEARYYES